MLKRVMRRALRGDPGDARETTRSPAERTAAPKAPAPSPQAPTPAPTAAAVPGSIAARLAGGFTEDPAAQVKATSGANAAGVGETEVHSAEDGTAYWGSVDNESARARAAGETLVIDQWECIACGTCVENTDAVFVLPDDAKAVPYQQEGDMELIQDAIDACPVTCIHWSEAPDQFEQLNDADGTPPD